MATDYLKNFHVVSFQKNLLSWYDRHKRDLPWRHSRDPYAIWLSEVMLQQTQVKTVIPYYNNWLQKFPGMKQLADADLNSVLKSWEGLGYYSRARQFHKAICHVHHELQSEVPDDYDVFLELPGVGEYTAAAVQSIAFGGAYAVVDGNVKRVLARLFEIDLPVNVANAKKTFQQIATELLHTQRSGDYNQALMELGATICKPRSPLCKECPVADLCAVQLNSNQHEYPKRKKRKPVPVYRMATGVVYRNDRVLITRRPEDGLLGGLWEFPGRNVEAAETSSADCKVAIKDAVNLEVEVGERIASVKHAYSHFKVEMDVYNCTYIAGAVELSKAVDFKWVSKEELAEYPFPGVNNKFLPLVIGSSGKKEEL
ncbi:MAG: A/G-specific adenine glycosylase [Calditrichia bacterium]